MFAKVSISLHLTISMQKEKAKKRTQVPVSMTEKSISEYQHNKHIIPDEVEE